MATESIEQSEWQPMPLMRWFWLDDSNVRLQQMWQRGLETGWREWRDVPVEKADEKIDDSE